MRLKPSMAALATGNPVANEEPHWRWRLQEGRGA